MSAKPRIGLLAIMQELYDHMIPGITERQADVLGLLRQGLRNSEIAQRLGISEKTAGHHVSAILAKLGVRTRQQAARHGETTQRTH